MRGRRDIEVLLLLLMMMMLMTATELSRCHRWNII
jgi:hypothetical protein